VTPRRWTCSLQWQYRLQNINLVQKWQAAFHSASEQFCLICIMFQAVCGHPVVDFVPLPQQTLHAYQTLLCQIQNQTRTRPYQSSWVIMSDDWWWWWLFLQCHAAALQCSHTHTPVTILWQFISDNARKCLALCNSTVQICDIQACVPRHIHD